MKRNNKIKKLNQIKLNKIKYKQNKMNKNRN